MKITEARYIFLISLLNASYVESRLVKVAGAIFKWINTTTLHQLIEQ